MASKPLLLEGQIDHTADLRDEVASMRVEIDSLRSQMAHAQQQNMKAILKLLSPFYKALQPFFGDLEPNLDNPEAPAGKRAQWDVIKQRLSPRQSEAVEILLLQGSMKRTQLASALGMDYSNCTRNVIGVLIRQGWIVVNGGNLSLKQL